MHPFLKILPILLSFTWISQAHSSSIYKELSCDYGKFYTSHNLIYQTFAFSYAGVMANSDFDHITEQYWQQHIRSPFTNHVANGVNSYADLTQYPIAIPVFLGVMWLGDDSWSHWANHSLRSLLLGGPLQLFLSHALGGGRPSQSSHWHLFKYHRAISGHAFYGAAPLLNFALQTENPFLKGIAFGASVLPGLARFNNDKHYSSQIFLGWWLAFSATMTVWQSDNVSKNAHSLQWQIIPIENGIYLGVNKKF